MKTFKEFREDVYSISNLTENNLKKGIDEIGQSFKRAGRYLKRQGKIEKDIGKYWDPNTLRSRYHKTAGGALRFIGKSSKQLGSAIQSTKPRNIGQFAVGVAANVVTPMALNKMGVNTVDAETTKKYANRLQIQSGGKSRGPVEKTLGIVRGGSLSPERAYEKAYGTLATRQSRERAGEKNQYGTRLGSAITGTGGNTTFNQRSNTVTSGQRTAKLDKTQLVRDPKTGKQVVGDLAYKGGKPVYLARPSISSRDTSIGANIGRALNVGRYSKEAERKAASREYKEALKNTQNYQKQLGITTQRATQMKLPGYGVGPRAMSKAKPK